MPPRLRRTLAALALALAATSSGCIYVVAGAGAVGAVAYIAGEATAVVPATTPRTNAAVRQTMDDLGLQIDEYRTSGTDGYALARSARHRRIEVNTRAVAPDRTEVAVRVDTFGDPDISRQIIDAISRRAAPPAKNTTAMR